jgi:hypothetical protein
MAVTITKFVDYAMTLEGGDINAGCNFFETRTLAGMSKRAGARYWGAIVEPTETVEGNWGVWKEIFPFGNN